MSTYPTELTLEQEIERALLALPEDPDDIAGLLLSMGITGTPLWGRKCPIACLLDREVRSVYDLHTRKTHVQIKDPGRTWVPIPHNVRTFIDRFDNLLYPELIDEDWL